MEGRRRRGKGGGTEVRRRRGEEEREEREPLTLTNCWTPQKTANVSRFHTERQTSAPSFKS